MPQPTVDDKIEARVESDFKQEIRVAAAIVGEPMSEFVRTATRERIDMMEQIIGPLPDTVPGSDNGVSSTNTENAVLGGGSDERDGG